MFFLSFSNKFVLSNHLFYRWNFKNCAFSIVSPVKLQRSGVTKSTPVENALSEGTLEAWTVSGNPCHCSQSWIVELVCFPESQNISTFSCKLCIQISRLNDQYLLYSVSIILAVLLRFKYLPTMDSSSGFLSTVWSCAISDCTLSL